MKLTLAAILLFLPFIIPVILQLVIGVRSLKQKTRLKIPQITLINIGLMIVGVFLLLLRMRVVTAITHDGLGYLFLIMLTAFTLILILCIAIIQYVLLRRRKRPLRRLK